MGPDSDGLPLPSTVAPPAHVRPRPPKRPRKRAPSPTMADPIMVVVSLLVGLACAAGVPSLLKITTAQLFAFGGLAVAVGAFGRGVWHWYRGEKVQLQDAIAAIFGAALATATAFGLPVDNLDPDLMGSMAAILASMFTARRTIKTGALRRDR